MKVFGWIQSKLKYGRQDESNHKPNLKSYENHITAVSEPDKEEVNDWLHGLLAIGTFGKNDIIEEFKRTNFHCDMPSSLEGHLHGSISYELRHMQDDLCSLLHNQDDQASELTQEPPFQIQFPSENAQCSKEPSAKSQAPSRTFVDKKKKGIIGKKSLSFLVNKILVCRSGFGLPPSNPPKASIPESRTEMIFRAILHKKIYPQSLNPSLTSKRYLESRNMAMSNSKEEDDMIEKANKGSKWVKTDSEYIVLEM